MGLAAPLRKTRLATEMTTSNFSKDQVSGGEDNLVGLSMKRCSKSMKETAPRNFLSPWTTTQVGTGTCVLCMKQGRPPRLQQR